MWKKNRNEGTLGECGLSKPQIVELCCRWSNGTIGSHYSFEALLDMYEWYTWPDPETRQKAWEENKDFIMAIDNIEDIDVSIGLCQRPICFFEYELHVSPAFLTEQDQERILDKHNLFLLDEQKRKDAHKRGKELEAKRILSNEPAEEGE